MSRRIKDTSVYLYRLAILGLTWGSHVVYDPAAYRKNPTDSTHSPSVLQLMFLQAKLVSTVCNNVLKCVGL